MRAGAGRRIHRERWKSGPFRYSASGRMRVPRARGGRPVAGVRGCAGCAPRPCAHTPPPSVGAPRRKRAGKNPAKGRTPRTRRPRGPRAGAPVSREGTPTLQVTAQPHPQLPGPRRIEAESITILWHPEGLRMSWVVLLHGMTPTCCHRPTLVKAGRRAPSTPPRCLPAPPATRSVQSLTADS